MNEDFRKIIITSDGSSTIFDPFFKENYHSVHGAIAESLHVFIENGLRKVAKEEISILEIGYGTGLNCLLTLLNKPDSQIIQYHSLEKYPLRKEMLSELNYSEMLNVKKSFFEMIFKQNWDIEKEISKGFKLKKIHADLLVFNFTETYDVIYFDAFSPNVQPELWTKEIFSKLYSCLNKNGILTTYSAKGDVKQALRSSGFKVRRMKGPVGKRHILFAVKE